MIFAILSMWTHLQQTFLTNTQSRPGLLCFDSHAIA